MTDPRTTDPRYAQFPAGFFQRADEANDQEFYGWPRLVTHIDDHAIAAVGALYERLGLHHGEVLDLMSSWVSHFTTAPAGLIALGMNADELARNAMATSCVVHDLNAEPRLPFADKSFDAGVCCVSIDYLTRPIEVLDDLARVTRPGGRCVLTFSNRLFPTKAVTGWLQADDPTRCAIATRYLELANGWRDIEVERCPTPRGADPLYAVHAFREREWRL